MAKAKVRKAGVTKKSKSPKRNRKGVFARDRSAPIRFQEHGFTIAKGEDGVERKVPNLFAGPRGGDSPTLMRQAFEAAGHPRCNRTSAGLRSSWSGRR